MITLRVSWWWRGSPQSSEIRSASQNGGHSGGAKNRRAGFRLFLLPNQTLASSCCPIDPRTLPLSNQCRIPSCCPTSPIASSRCPIINSCPLSLSSQSPATSCCLISPSPFTTRQPVPRPMSLSNPFLGGILRWSLCARKCQDRQCSLTGGT